MIGINLFEGLWGNFLDDYDEFCKMKDIVFIYCKEVWIWGFCVLGIYDDVFGVELVECFLLECCKIFFVYEEMFEVFD